MGQYDRAIATAQRLIAKYGQVVVWNSKLNGAPGNANEPWKPTDTAPIPHTVSICFVPVRDRETRKFLQFLKGSEVQVGALAGLMGAVDFDPNASDAVIRDGAELAIANIDLLSPNGQKVLYTIEFKE